MKKFVNTLLFLTLITSLPAFAQKEAKAKEWLDKASTIVNQSGGISASFTINIKEVTNNVSESFEGQIFLKGNKFCMDSPEQAVYFDGKTQWVYAKSLEEVTILEPKPQDIQTLNPAFVFEMYKKDCNYKYLGEKKDNKMRKVQEISLLPNDKKGDISRIDVQINSTDGMPVFFHIYYSNKMENTIHINKYQTNLNLPDSQFTFDMKKYPQTEVNDLR